MSTVPTHYGRRGSWRAGARFLTLVVAAVVAVAAGAAVPAGLSGRGGAPATIALAAPASQEMSGEDLGDFFRGEYARALAELRAATTCAGKQAAFERLVGIERQWQLLGYGEDGIDEASGNVAAEVVVFCYDEYFVKCQELQDPMFGMLMIKGLGQAQRFNLDGLLDESKIDRCLTFELRLEGRFELRLPGYEWMTHSHSSVPLKLAFADERFKYTGLAPLESLRFTHQAPVPIRDTRVEPGELTASIVGGDFGFGGFSFSYEAGTLKGGQPLNLQMDLQLSGMPMEHWVMALGPGMEVPLLAPWWSIAFNALHQDELQPGASYLIQGFQHVGGSVYARKTYVRPGTAEGGYAVDEQTTVELWHTPKA